MYSRFRQAGRRRRSIHVILWAASHFGPILIRDELASDLTHLANGLRLGIHVGAHSLQMQCAWKQMPTSMGIENNSLINLAS